MKIHDVKVNYPMKAKLLNTLVKDFNSFKVKLESLSYSEDDSMKVFTFNLVSSKDEYITKLLRYLTKEHEERFNFSTNEILYKEDNKKYFSELKVKIL